jgi:hypothetical protein
MMRLPWRKPEENPWDQEPLALKIPPGVNALGDLWRLCHGLARAQWEISRAQRAMSRSLTVNLICWTIIALANVSYWVFGANGLITISWR